jgi:hypothetical protein
MIRLITATRIVKLTIGQWNSPPLKKANLVYMDVTMRRGKGVRYLSGEPVEGDAHMEFQFCSLLL